MIAAIAVALPFLAAACAALLRPAAVRGWVPVAASVLALAGIATIPDGSPWWQTDGVSRVAAGTAALVAALSAWSDQFGPARTRWEPALFLVTLGCLLLAVLSASPAASVLAFSAAAAAARTNPAPSLEVRSVLASGFLAALFGLAMLAAGSQDPAALGLALPLLLLGLGALALAPGTGPFAGPLPLAALVLLGRLRDGMLANVAAVQPGPAMIVAGLAALAGGVVALWWRRDAAAVVPGTALAASGMALGRAGPGKPRSVAPLGLVQPFRLGGPVGSWPSGAAGRLDGSGGSGRPGRGLPPIGLFASAMPMLEQMVAITPLAALPMAAGFVAVTCAVLRHLPEALSRTGTSARLPLAGGWAALAILLLGGVAGPRIVGLP